MTPRWQILEASGRGHRLWYVSLLLRRISRMDPTPNIRLVTRADVMCLPSWKEHIDPWRRVIVTDIFPSNFSRLQILRRAAANREPMILPDADSWLPALVYARLLFGHRFSGSILLMRPEPDSSLSSAFRHKGKILLKGMVRKLHPNLEAHDLVAVADSRGGNQLQDPVDFVPSGVKRDEWLSMHGLNSDLKWMVILGEISERKYIDVILESMAANGKILKGWGLVIIGNTSCPDLADRLAGLMHSNTQSIVFRNDFLSDADFDTWILHADVVPVLHRNEGSSGILLKCWAANTFSIVGGAGSVTEAARLLDMPHFALGSISPPGLIKALTEVENFIGGGTVDDKQWERRSQDFADRLLGLS